ncbi:hypothetical protein SAMD00019534_048240 [Acytostelium subglobosum LB1]|uniref:hypothetical protein n=1 Tax=Acytostelium subglobosum LB1 TaxID=1410327 RepID=UPI000644B539|nr:hypothetical protein SAMD00019534_048240 [Acytostelium subglobosum LB1]GAM21649.1 hypothetical protein SAMD00019534_048240 [Acytostelium subglobosum LB1]|eukprot:XP_012755768.1 hypothetical protein SAMD00019534_048240 [Acytostelium subglobosum LB1]
MSETGDLKKDFKSAICIAPPIELCDQLQVWRSLYDSAYNRWMPHINLIFPFVTLEQFDNKFNELQTVIGKIPAFKLRFDDFSYFQHGKGKCVVWMKPTTDRPNVIADIQAALESVLVGFNEQSSKSPNGFCPHMTVGQFGGKKATEEKIAGFRGVLRPIETDVTEIQMINRVGQDTPFTVVKTLKLGVGLP